MLSCLFTAKAAFERQHTVFQEVSEGLVPDPKCRKSKFRSWPKLQVANLESVRWQQAWSALCLPLRLPQVDLEAIQVHQDSLVQSLLQTSAVCWTTAVSALFPCVTASIDSFRCYRTFLQTRTASRPSPRSNPRCPVAVRVSIDRRWPSQSSASRSGSSRSFNCRPWSFSSHRQSLFVAFGCF